MAKNLAVKMTELAAIITAGQIGKVVEAQKERLLQQAREERALELAKEQADAEYDLRKARQPAKTPQNVWPNYRRG